MDNTQLQTLLDTLGLEEILLQCDIDQHAVLRLLDEEGLIDMEDYFYEDVPLYLQGEEE